MIQKNDKTEAANDAEKNVTVEAVDWTENQNHDNDEIYIINIDGSNRVRLTNNRKFDWFPAWDPMGRRVSFNSEQFGGQELMLSLADGAGRIRITNAEKTYEQESVFSPDGKDLALIHRVGKDYRLALLDIASRYLTVLTQNKSDESPYFSPNGGMIIYATNKDNKGILSIISLHNNQSVELMRADGELREPSWSNYSN